jgi:DNA-3-methyladenine glycosylase II
MASIKQQIEHLRKDKKLAGVIEKVGTLKLEKHDDLYLGLMRSIVGQQLSVKAAATIWGRFLDLFPERYPHDKLLMKLDVEKLRAVGLSYQKAGYIQNIARFAKEETLDYAKLKKLDDEDLIVYLTQIKGVGRWTTEMILMFTLGRENVLPLDDLGIQVAMSRLYKLEGDKKSLKIQMQKKAEIWEPYRTLACKYLWRYKDAK